jgi:hypothetical protein
MLEGQEGTQNPSAARQSTASERKKYNIIEFVERFVVPLLEVLRWVQADIQQRLQYLVVVGYSREVQCSDVMHSIIDPKETRVTRHENTVVWNYINKPPESLKLFVFIFIELYLQTDEKGRRTRTTNHERKVH